MSQKKNNLKRDSELRTWYEECICSFVQSIVVLYVRRFSGCEMISMTSRSSSQFFPRSNCRFSTTNCYIHMYIDHNSRNLQISSIYFSGCYLLAYLYDKCIVQTFSQQDKDTKTTNCVRQHDTSS